MVYVNSKNAFKSMPLHVGTYIIFFPMDPPYTGLFSVKIQKKFLAIKNFSVNDTMSGQPNKRLSSLTFRELIWLVFLKLWSSFFRTTSHSLTFRELNG